MNREQIESFQCGPCGWSVSNESGGWCTREVNSYVSIPFGWTEKKNLWKQSILANHTGMTQVTLETFSSYES